ARAAVTQQRCIGFDAPPPTAAEERMDGHVFELAAQIPQGNVESADGMDYGSGAPEIVQRALEPRRQASIGRVLAERERRDPMVERRGGCLPRRAPATYRSWGAGAPQTVAAAPNGPWGCGAQSPRSVRC